jgi:Caspase domain
VMLLVSIAPAAAQSRVALVIGNSAYASAPPLRTTAADADLVASSLQAAGFDIVRANDVTTANFGDTIAAFVAKVSAGGPNTVAFVYFAGYGVQYEGDSYLVPVDATIAHADDVPNVTMSLTAVEQALAQVPAAARIIVLDAARDGGFANGDASPIAPGLALVGVPPGFLLAYPAAPGADICACAEDQPNSPYASSLALLRQPGLEIGQIFDGVRLQINQASGGAQLPWMVSALGVEVRFFQATAGGPKTFLPALGLPDLPVPPLEPVRWTMERYRTLSADEAYRIAIERDSLETYQWFVEAFPTYPLAGQIWQIINWRRESILWHRALVMGTVDAYWNYLVAYPDGRYARSARYWLELRHAPLVPAGYTPVVLELPPGYVDEAIGLPIVLERGRPVPLYFGNVQPVYIAAVPHWAPQRVAIVVRPPPPPPPPTLIVRQAAFVQRVPVVAQSVQPVFNPALTVQQQQQKQRELQAWQGRVNQQQQAVAKQYHTPVVTQTSIALPPANAGAHKPAGIQIPSKPVVAVPPSRGPQQAVTPPPNKGLTIPNGNGKPAPNGTQHAVTPPPNRGPQQAVVPPANKGLTIPNGNGKPAPNGTQHAVTPPPNRGPAVPNAKPGPGGPQQAVTPPPKTGSPPNAAVQQQQRLQQDKAAQERAAQQKAAQEKAAQEKAAQERANLERQKQLQQKPVQHPQPPRPPQPPAQQAHQPPPQPPKPAPPKPPQPAPQQARQQQPKPPQPAPHPAGCPAGQHMANGHCVK